MDIVFKKEGTVLSVFIKGEIDHHFALSIKDKIDNKIIKEKIDLLILDIKEVSFMDSSGIGLIVGRYNKLKSLGAKMQIRNANTVLYRILKMSGILNIIEVAS